MAAPRVPSSTTCSATVRAIVDEVAAKHAVSRVDIVTRPGCMTSHFREHVLAMREVMLRLRRETRMSLPQIAGALGLKNHTSVLNGLRKYQRDYEARKVGVI